MSHALRFWLGGHDEGNFRGLFVFVVSSFVTFAWLEVTLPESVFAGRPIVADPSFLDAHIDVCSPFSDPSPSFIQGGFISELSVNTTWSRDGNEINPNIWKYI